MDCGICGGTVFKDDVVIVWSEHKDESGAVSLDDINLSHKSCHDRVPGGFDYAIHCDTKKTESKTPEDVVMYLVENYQTRSEKAELKFGQIFSLLFDVKPRRKCID